MGTVLFFPFLKEKKRTISNFIKKKECDNVEIIIGKSSGFCAGVKNAIIKTEQELKQNKQKIDCLGELVHNRQVIERLEKEGLNLINHIEEAKNKVIIRAHGIAKEIYEIAQKNGIELIDLTCPKVLKIHEIIDDYSKKGYYTILIGIKEHPEVIGSISFAGEKSSLITEKEEIEETIKQIEKLQIKKILIVAQTTFNLKKFEEISQEIKEKLNNEYVVEIKNTICPATKIRQEETNEISQKVDYMIIVGGKNSSNTKKLYDISIKNCKNVECVETVKELNINKVKEFDKIGIMAGASTPNESVEEIVKALKGED